MLSSYQTEVQVATQIWSIHLSQFELSFPSTFLSWKILPTLTFSTKTGIHPPTLHKHAHTHTQTYMHTHTHTPTHTHTHTLTHTCTHKLAGFSHMCVCVCKWGQAVIRKYCGHYRGARAYGLVTCKNFHYWNHLRQQMVRKDSSHETLQLKIFWQNPLFVEIFF